MRKSLLVALAVVFPLSNQAKEDVCPQYLPDEVEARIAPILKKHGAIHEQQQSEADLRPLVDDYDAALDELFAAKDSTSKEARVALMDFYVGEGPGELLTCAVAQDDGVDALLDLYSKCDIKPRHLQSDRNHGFPLRTYAAEIRKAGNAKQQCTYDN